jgi:hypothetical protein
MLELGGQRMPDGNGDYQSRFDRMEKMAPDFACCGRPEVLDEHARI